MIWRRRRAGSESADDLLARLGRLTAQARERVEFQQARVELAEALQNVMLPAELPATQGMRVAARYTPARHGLDIGGDWYDGFRMPDGSYAFSIGDVQGHDVEAAAFMGQIRIALRATANTVTDPGEILARTNDLLMSVDLELFATCSFYRFDPVHWELQGARAGHVGAVWATIDGRFGVDEDAGGLPLGIVAGETYPVTRHALTSAGAFVLVTDGVVEGPSCPVEQGLARIAKVVQANVAADPGTLATEVIRSAESVGHADDAAVLVMCHDAKPA